MVSASGADIVQIISDILPFGAHVYGGRRARQCDWLCKVLQPLTRCVIRLYDEAGNVIETQEHQGAISESGYAAFGAPDAHPLLASYNLCPVRPVWATTGNQGCHSYSPVAHRPRNTRPEKAGSFLSVILRQTIIGGHGNGCQFHPKLASLCRFRATLNRYAPADTDPSPRMRNLTL